MKSSGARVFVNDSISSSLLYGIYKHKKIYFVLALVTSVSNNNNPAALLWFTFFLPSFCVL